MPGFPGCDSLTGQTRYRNGWFGTLVLQVEERAVAYWAGRLQPGVERTPVYENKWRDAKTTDFRILEYIERKRNGENPAPPDD